MPFGLTLDLWECYLQETGRSKPHKEVTIDEVIPLGI